MTSVLNQKAARRVSIIAQKPVLVKSSSSASTLQQNVSAPLPLLKKTPSVSAVVCNASPAPSPNVRSKFFNFFLKKKKKKKKKKKINSNCQGSREL
jgi:hypothetical protein